MGKNNIGKCKICGLERKLTYEHVPPRTTFNEKPIKIYSAETLLNAEDEGREPWQLEGLTYDSKQRGAGDYYLCESCNNKMGIWYVPYYEKFVKAISVVWNECDEHQSKAARVELSGIRPLPVIKQILAMFCDINENCFGDDSIRSFLLDKDSTTFNKNKYRIFMYMRSGEIERQVGITVSFNKETGPVLLSEISAGPVGFILYIDAPSNLTTDATDITDFVDCSYETSADVSIELNLLENNSFFPGDYRTKAEIRQTREENERWLTEDKQF